LLEIATARAGSSIVLIKETPPDPEGFMLEAVCLREEEGT